MTTRELVNEQLLGDPGCRHPRPLLASQRPSPPVRTDGRKPTRRRRGRALARAPTMGESGRFETAKLLLNLCTTLSGTNPARASLTVSMRRGGCAQATDAARFRW